MGELQCNLIIDSCCDLPVSVVNGEGVELLKFPYTVEEQALASAGGDPAFVGATKSPAAPATAGLELLKFPYTVDGESYFDDFFQTLDPAAFYNTMREGAACSTSQVSIVDLREAFSAAIATGRPTVYLGFTSGLSGTFDAAAMVAESLLQENPGAELYVVDTRLASVAEGTLIYTALAKHREGATAKEIADWAETARNYVCEQFTLESLEWLARGGRIPPAVAFAGSKLDVKPVLDIALDGTLGLTAVARGRKKGLRHLVEYFQENYRSPEDVAADGAIGCASNPVILGHADCAEDAARVKADLLHIYPDLEIIDTNIGPVIGSHVGPGMIAVSFFGPDQRS